ncbi:MAG: hypothetical protein ACI3YC_09570, partial [Alloprevotella sp.]
MQQILSLWEIPVLSLRFCLLSASMVLVCRGNTFFLGSVTFFLGLVTYRGTRENASAQLSFLLREVLDK